MGNVRFHSVPVNQKSSEVKLMSSTSSDIREDGGGNQDAHILEV